MTSAVTMTPGAKRQVGINTQPPATVKASTPFSMQPAIEDAYGNVVSTASGTLRVTFATNLTGATFGGTTSLAISPGVAFLQTDH
jgi:hypothetical protein